MRRPSFQFYPADWRNNAKLRRCSWEARGCWVEILCLFHDSEEYGVLRWTLREIAQAVGAPLKVIRELADKGVVRGADADCQPFSYTPRHANKDGAPVEIIRAEAGPCWFSSRMVVDEYVRQRRGFSTRFDEPKPTPKPTPKTTFGYGTGEGSSSSSSSSDIDIEKREREDAENPSDPPGSEPPIGKFVAMCARHSIPEWYARRQYAVWSAKGWSSGKTPWVWRKMGPVISQNFVNDGSPTTEPSGPIPRANGHAPTKRNELEGVKIKT